MPVPPVHPSSSRIERTPEEKRKQLAAMKERVANMKDRESAELKSGMLYAIANLEKELDNGRS